MSSSAAQSLAVLADQLQGVLQGTDAAFDGISTDTRQLKPGQLFVALVGEQMDGHQFLSQAVASGASGAVVSQPYAGPLPTILVEDTLQALTQMARQHRQRLQLPIIAVTGSCGKTTTKNILATILGLEHQTLVNPSSFNNHIGVPLTLLQLLPQHTMAVTEMGANHAGEIAFLTGLVTPQVAMITNAAGVHLEGFGSLAGVARAKGEIFQGLPPAGIAVINADDAFADFWRELAAPRRVLTFGVNQTADVMAQDVRLDAAGRPQFSLCLPEAAPMTIALPLLGRHNVYNALAAAAGAWAVGISAAIIQRGLQAVSPVSGRLVEFEGLKGTTIIDDSYNANPTSVLAAIRVLVNRPGTSVLVLGDMLELGPEAINLHREIGAAAREAGVARLYGYGPLTQQTVSAFGAGASHFDDHQTLLAALIQDLTADVTVLVKGSNSMQMCKIVQGLTPIGVGSR